MRVAAAVVICPMPEEVEPVLELARAEHARITPVGAPGSLRAWRVHVKRLRFLLVQCGIGLTQAACGVTWALGKVSTHQVYLCGTAGGLGEDIQIGDVVVGTGFRYSMADATAFGYEPGQIPGQPQEFTGVHRHGNLDDFFAKELPSFPVHRGLMLSGDSFVTASMVDGLLKTHPGALSVDMETAAAAQVANDFGASMLAVRGISDLCSPKAAADFDAGVGSASERAAQVLWALLAHTRRVDRRPRKVFSSAMLTAGVFAAVAIAAGAKEKEPADLPQELADELTAHMTPEDFQRFAGLVAAGIAVAAENPDFQLPAQHYDRMRTRMLDDLEIPHGPGKHAWPPSSQTVMKRLDCKWNDVLTRVGLGPVTRRTAPRRRYSDEDYNTAIYDFHTWATSEGLDPSYASYQEWLGKQKDRRPSGASVRQHYGSWADAILSLYVTD